MDAVLEMLRVDAMALYAIGDTHLSLGVRQAHGCLRRRLGRDMWTSCGRDFPCWSPEDTVVLCGDLSWGMSLEEAQAGLCLSQTPCPGRKLLLKGNHDYWWTTAAKMNRFFAENGFDNLSTFSTTTAHLYGDVALCGTRGWFYEEERGGHSREDLQPGADPAGGLPEGGGGAGEVLLPPLSAPVSGIPVPGDSGPAGAVSA